MISERLRGIYAFPFQVFLGCVASLGALASMAYVPALPLISESLGAAANLVNWTMTLSFVGGVIGQLFWGPFSDHYSRKLALCLGSGIACVGCFVGFLTSSIYVILAVRFFVGFGAATGVIVARAICRDLYTEEMFARMIAWILTVIPFSSGIVPAIANGLVEALGWRSSFALLFIISLILLILTPLFLKGKPQIITKCSPSYIFKSYVRFFGHLRTMGMIFASSLIYVCFFVFISSSPWIYQKGFLIKGWLLSLALFTFPFGTFIGGLFLSFVGWRYPTRALLSRCWPLLIIATGCNFLYFFFIGDHGLWIYIICMMFFGGCSAVFNSICTARAMAQHPPEYAGNLSSFIGAFQLLGCAVGSFFASYTTTALSVAAILLGMIVISIATYVFVNRSEEQKASRSPASPKYTS
jgi:DHA1 family bicyclomycin/chloramphenicol resistance-like MFS transporter